MSYRVYCFSYNNPERKAAMEHRFATVGVPLHWVPAVGPDDERIRPDDSSPRTTAMMLGHLEMLRAFLSQEDDEYGIFCEDDIFIRRDFPTSVTRAIELYRHHSLELFLLGYLINYHPCQTSGPTDFHVLEYGNEQWGSQMYLLDRVTAQKMLDAFAEKSSVSVPYSPDWTITKIGKRAMIYPMLAVESGMVGTTHPGQVQYHRACFEFNYSAELHI